MIAALYVRVSSEMQIDNFSIPAQISALQEYCDKNKINIFKIYEEKGVSGQKENRPAFQEMLKDAEAKCFDIILVHKFDRFARNTELSQRVKKDLRKNGINIISITEPIEDSPLGFFTEGIMELLAEYYVRNLAAESKKGQVERAKQGLDNGSIPFGYCRNKETGIMEINPEQARIVKIIFDMYVNKGYGSTKISAELNKSNVKSALNKEWKYYTVHRILNNVKYIGKIYYDGEIYKGKHKPIIDENTFLKVQKYMKDRTWKTSYRGSNYNKFLFLGLLKCGVCNAAITVRRVHKKKDTGYVFRANYYYCNRSMRIDYSKRCINRKGYRVEKIEDEILKELNKFLTGVKTPKISNSFTPDYNLNMAKLNRIKKEENRAKKAYLSGVFSLEEYAKLKQKHEIELKEIKKQKSKNKEEILMKKFKNFNEKFYNLNSIAEKKALLKEIIDCIYIDPDKIVIKFFV